MIQVTRRRHDVDTRVAGHRRALAVAAVLPGLLWAAAHARAGDLANVVSDLYGGDGILLAPPLVGFDHAPHFTVGSLMGLDNLNSAVISGLGVFAFNSPVSGFTFDIETGEPRRISESLGPLLAEQALTLGAKRFDIAFSYTRIDYTHFEGSPLDDLSLTFVHQDVNGDGVQGPLGTPLEFELDVIDATVDLTLRQDVFAFFSTYGVTSIWDVGIVVPVVHTEARATAVATIVDNSPNFPNPHFFDPAAGSDEPISTTGGTATGLGDILLRTKVNFLRNHETLPDMAVFGQVTLPTGDAKDLLGTGETFILATYVASKSYGPVAPHLNVGFEVAPNASELNNLRYILGFEAATVPQLTLIFDFLGRWEPSGDGIGDNRMDMAVGTRWNFAGDSILNLNVLIPVNLDEGLRAEVIWSIGIEHTF